MTRIFKLLGTKNRPYSNQALRVWWKVAVAAFFPLDTRHAGSAVGVVGCVSVFSAKNNFLGTQLERCSAASGSTTFRCLQRKQLPPACLFHPILGPSPAGPSVVAVKAFVDFTLWTSQHPSHPSRNSQGTDDFYMLNSGLLLSSSGAF